MFSFLKNHPFAIEAHFDFSVTLTFAVPRSELQHLIPECFTLDTYNQDLAFIAVALVQTKDLRAKGFPRFMGQDFFLAGYRIFVRYKNQQGKQRRGLYILKSETDSKKMEFGGNIFTRYRFSKTDIQLSETNGIVALQSKKSGFDVKYAMEEENEPLPAYSPFNNWHDAKRFSGPLPFTFSFNKADCKVSIVEGVRQNWKPLPVKILDYHFPFFVELNLQHVVLAHAFVVRHIPYYWKKGKTEIWSQ